MYYSAKLLFEMKTQPQADDRPLKEERIVLFEALDESEAQEKAMAAGQESEHEYESSDGNTVMVKFLELKKIYEINSEQLSNGTEVFSEFIY